MRAFIALALPNAALHQIITVQRLLVQQLRTQQLDRCMRWTPADNLHLTLRFLGEIDDAQQLSLAQKWSRRWPSNTGVWRCLRTDWAAFPAPGVPVSSGVEFRAI